MVNRIFEEKLNSRILFFSDDFNYTVNLQYFTKKVIEEISKKYQRNIEAIPYPFL
ncbi:MAG: hypothetical protein HXX16_17250 [Bacteroidales bacterium]|nr:hypothetical protein [Bacteroidales bacterium]